MSEGPKPAEGGETPAVERPADPPKTGEVGGMVGEGGDAPTPPREGGMIDEGE